MNESKFISPVFLSTGEFKNPESLLSAKAMDRVDQVNTEHQFVFLSAFPGFPIILLNLGFEFQWNSN